MSYNFDDAVRILGLDLGPDDHEFGDWYVRGGWRQEGDADLDDRCADDYETPPCDYDDTEPRDEHAEGQQYTLTVCFDADSELESLLIASDILVRLRKTTAQNVAVILT